MDVITYSLRDGQPRSDQYYRDVAAFTDEVLTEAENHIRLLVDAFQLYVGRTGRETPRTRPEYTFDLLTLGVLWLVYARAALGLAKAPQQTLALAVHVYSSKRPTSKNSSQLTCFLPIVKSVMPFSLVHFLICLSSSALASLVGPTLP